MATVATIPEVETPDAPLADNLGWLLSQANHALQTEMTARLEETGIFPRGNCVMIAAVEGGPLTQTEIARLVGLDKTTMVTTVDELEAAGFVERILSPTDRRARVIRVTAAGKRKMAQARRIVEQLQDEVLDSLPAGERKALLSGLSRLVDDRLSAPPECGRAVRRRD
jgi:DNA-binding MarR family transcriptional regulator